MSRRPAAHKSAGEGTAAFTVQNARLADVSFLTQQVLLGVKLAVFGSQLAHPFHLLQLVRQCCFGILGNYPVLRWFSGGRRFLVAKDGEATVGAMLVRWGRGAEKYRVLIEYLVVEAGRRRGGAGSGLVRHLIALRSRPEAILAACSPNAKGMMTMLGRLGFKRKRRAEATTDLVAPFLFELRLEASRTRDAAASARKPGGAKPPASPASAA
ncbi:MAG: GNAT family N-acetyltransferase [Nevskia sp.]|nr:GNAT family N-acetyltransferase [Nevskia sp.]